MEGYSSCPPPFNIDTFSAFCHDCLNFLGSPKFFYNFNNLKEVSRTKHFKGSLIISTRLPLPGEENFEVISRGLKIFQIWLKRALRIALRIISQGFKVFFGQKIRGVK